MKKVTVLGFRGNECRSCGIRLLPQHERSATHVTHTRKEGAVALQDHHIKDFTTFQAVTGECHQIARAPRRAPARPGPHAHHGG